MTACVWVASGCAGQREVVRLPPLELALGPDGTPLLAWPTAFPPARVDAFRLERKLMRMSWWHPQADYCIDPSGRLTSVEVSHSQVPDRVAKRVRGWSFEPWAGGTNARFCESAVMYDDDESHFGRATIMVYVPIVPPARPLPADGSLEHAPARMLHDKTSILLSFWDTTNVPGLEPEIFEPGFGEIVVQLCVDGDGDDEIRDVHRHLAWLPERQQEWLELLLVQGHNLWRFTPRIEGGVPVDDCKVEVRYAVWVMHHYALSYHERLDEILDVDGYGLPFRPLPNELEPWAEHGPIQGIDGASAPAMIETPSWLPPYELAATMPAAMPLRTVRVRFCVPAAGGHPTEVRVLDSDTQELERPVLRLVAEGVARWRAEASEGDSSSICGDVEWQIGRRVWAEGTIP